jgi:hypothetical protein
MRAHPSASRSGAKRDAANMTNNKRPMLPAQSNAWQGKDLPPSRRLTVIGALTLVSAYPAARGNLFFGNRGLRLGLPRFSQMLETSQGALSFIQTHEDSYPPVHKYLP